MSGSVEVRHQQAPIQQMLLTQTFSNVTQYAKDSIGWKAITAVIAYHIAKDMASIATVEHCGFKKIVKTLDIR